MSKVVSISKDEGSLADQAYARIKKRIFDFDLMPGDPALAIAGTTASEREVLIIRQELGLDRPFDERYVDFVTGVVQGDFGRSFFNGQDVLEDIFRYLPASLELMFVSLSLAAVIGLTIGAIAGYFRRRAPDARTATSDHQSLTRIPVFDHQNPFPFVEPADFRPEPERESIGRRACAVA